MCFPLRVLQDPLKWYALNILGYGTGIDVLNEVLNFPKVYNKNTTMTSVERASTLNVECTVPQSVFSCSKSTMKTTEQHVKSVES